MATTVHRVTSRWKLCKGVLAALAVVSCPPAAIVIYHICQLRVNNIAIDIREVERSKQSYIEVGPMNWCTKREREIYLFRFLLCCHFQL